MSVTRLLTCIGLGLLLVPACSSDDADGGGADASSTTVSPVDTSAAGGGTGTTAGSGAGEPMTTPRDATAEIVGLLGTPGPTVETADELAQAVATALVAAASENECEAGDPTAVVTSVTPGEPTFAVVELRVGCDDSVAGTRYDLAMEPDDSVGWSLSASTRQDICKRGGGGEDLCP